MTDKFAYTERIVRTRHVERECNRLGAAGFRVVSVTFYSLGHRRIRAERVQAAY